MRIGIISGSHRNPSQSEKVARYIENQLAEKFEGLEPWVFALAENPIPLWDKWLVWDDRRWRVDQKKRVERLAQMTVRMFSSDDPTRPAKTSEDLPLPEGPMTRMVFWCRSRWRSSLISYARP